MGSARAAGKSSAKWWASAPRVVAEELVPLRDPLADFLVPGPEAEPSHVVRALAAALAPPRAADAPPPWLDEAQGEAFQQLLYIVRAHGAALCAEPVGSGKTYLALAVARALRAEPATCIVPASLLEQWRRTANRLGVGVDLWSHTQLSRGRQPPGNPGLVIIDESHHLRNPGTRRYRTLAPWLIGRRVLLLSATPAVNRPADLYAQLHLGLRDDVLASAGAPSLRAAFGVDNVPAELGQFVIQRLQPGPVPVRLDRTESASSGAMILLPHLDRLVLSTHPDVAALVRAVLLHAAASSLPALMGALRRYRLLLLQAEEALRAGHAPDRKRLRSLLGRAPEQLQLWSVLPIDGEEGDLALEDLPLLEQLVCHGRESGNAHDAKSHALAALLADGKPTLVFVTARETIPFLRRVLPDPWLAWCTGARSGIGSATMPRSDVLRWFIPGASLSRLDLPGRPKTLLTTDVAAEGLDLQDAARVVHYDLPWTDVRLVQRDGRAVRRGSPRPSVECVRFLPGPEIESRLHQTAILSRKSQLPEQLGLGPAGVSRWGWRRRLSDAAAGPGVGGIAAVRSDREGALAGVALERGGAALVSRLFTWAPPGPWRADSRESERRMREGEVAVPCPLPGNGTIRRLLGSLSPSVREMLWAASVARVSGVQPVAAARRLAARLRRLAAMASRDRAVNRLQELDRALQFACGAHTAGESMLVEELASLDDEMLVSRLRDVPDPSPSEQAPQPRVTGVLLFLRQEDYRPACASPARR